MMFTKTSIPEKAQIFKQFYGTVVEAGCLGVYFIYVSIFKDIRN